MQKELPKSTKIIASSTDWFYLKSAANIVFTVPRLERSSSNSWLSDSIAWTKKCQLHESVWWLKWKQEINDKGTEHKLLHKIYDNIVDGEIPY